MSSAALLVVVTTTSAWAADDKADPRGQDKATEAQAGGQGQDRAAEAQAEAAARQAENDRRSNDAGRQDANARQNDNAPRPNGQADRGGDARAAQTNPDGSKDPGGNNGTIKVDLLPFDDSGRHDTDTHSDDDRCLVEIEFFGFDADEVVNVTFFGVAPTRFGALAPVAEVPGDGNDAQVTLDGDGVTGTGDDTTEKLDGQQQYDLSAALQGKPASRNGYHIRVEADAVDAPGGAKTKVFWLNCNPTAPVTGAGTTGGSAGTTTETGAGTTGGSAGTTTETGAVKNGDVAAGAVIKGIAPDENAIADADKSAAAVAQVPGQAAAVAQGAPGPATAVAQGSPGPAAAVAQGSPGQPAVAGEGEAVERAKTAAQAGKGQRPERLQVMGVQFDRGNKLARTGVPIALLALAGLGLVGVGTALRRAGRPEQETGLEA